jgi:hypothetical protein
MALEAGPAHFRLCLPMEMRAYLRSVRRLLVTANVPNSPILVTVMKEAVSSPETSALTRATRRNISGDAILPVAVAETLVREQRAMLQPRNVNCFLPLLSVSCRSDTCSIMLLYFRMV